MTTRQTKQFEIGAHTYRATMMGGSDQSTIWFRILRFIGPVILSGRKAGTDEEKGEAFLSELLRNVSTLPEEDYKLAIRLCEQSCKLLQIPMFKTGPGTPIEIPLDFDEHFSGRMVEAHKWLFEMLSFNFGGSFLALGGLISSTKKSENGPNGDVRLESVENS